MVNKILTKFFVVGLAVFLVISIPGLRAQPPAAVGVDEVYLEPLVQTVPVIGRIVSQQGGAVSSRIGGAVIDVRVSIGDRVQKGQILALLDSKRLQRHAVLLRAEELEAEAQVQFAEARLALESLRLSRLARLRESAAFSRGRYDDTVQEVVVAEASVNIARARNERANANVAITSMDLSNTKIRAPYGGVVTQLHTEIGGYVRAGDQVVTMLNDRELEIEAEVPTIYVLRLEAGSVSSVTVGDDNNSYEAVLRAIVPEENPLTRTQRVRFTPDKKMAQLALSINQAVTINLPLGLQEEVITVHKDAIILRQGTTFVYVVDAGKANLRPIKLGIAVGGRFVVLDGLLEGELTVIRGNERLQPGQDVITGNAS